MNTAPKPAWTLRIAPVAIAAWPLLLFAQVPVDADGNPLGTAAETSAAQSATGNEDIPLLATAELAELVGPIALYPDDLLAIVLPASTYPLQIVQAGRFLDELEKDPSLQPDSAWDDSVVALTNYPDVVKLLNEDLDWTWRLGEAVVAQQSDVIAAIETFRDRAYAAGNLKSDAHQSVARNGGVIEITPVSEDTIYVPYYEPEHVIVQQPRPVYFYYPRPCPVYYYPYASSYAFDRGFFWGVTTAFSIGWYTDRLHVFHHSYRGHPYFGRPYRDRWWYRRPSLHVHNHYYPSTSVNISINRFAAGDYWRPQHRRTVRYSDRRITRTRYYPGSSSSGSRDGATDRARVSPNSTLRAVPNARQAARIREAGQRARASADVATPERRTDRRRSDSAAQVLRQAGPRDSVNTIRFRERPPRTDSRGQHRTATPRDTVRTERRSNPPARADIRQGVARTMRDARRQRPSPSVPVRRTITPRKETLQAGTSPTRRVHPATERAPKSRARSVPPTLASGRASGQRDLRSPPQKSRAPERHTQARVAASNSTKREAKRREQRPAARAGKSERRQERSRTRVTANARQR